LAPSAVAAGQSLALASVLFLKLDDRFPLKIDVAVPATVQPGSGTGASSVRAAFAFDARPFWEDEAPAGLHQVYLVAGDQVVGPCPMLVGSP